MTVPGNAEINAAEAAAVVRVSELFAAGVSPRATRNLTADPPPPVRLHPHLGQEYRAKVERLYEARALTPGCGTRP